MKMQENSHTIHPTSKAILLRVVLTHTTDRHRYYNVFSRATDLLHMMNLHIPESCLAGAWYILIPICMTESCVDLIY